MTVSILDCTLRDGGNVNNWRFTIDQVRDITSGLAQAGVDVVEVGYVGGSGSNRSADVGPTADVTDDLLRHIGACDGTRLAVQAVASVVEPSRLDALVDSSVEIVRVACYPWDVPRATALVGHVTRRGLTASLNIMASSYATPAELAASAAAGVEAGASVVYLADSFGSLVPDQVRERIAAVRVRVDTPVGFHGHDNLGLACANALAAVEAGASWLDGSLAGLARGAGNLATEVLAALAERGVLDARARVAPLLAARRVVAEEIGRPTSGDDALETGLADVHVYFHPLVRDRCDETGSDRAAVLAELGARRPRRVDPQVVDEVIVALSDGPDTQAGRAR